MKLISLYRISLPWQLGNGRSSQDCPLANQSTTQPKVSAFNVVSDSLLTD